jgi:hypothetical protein
MYVLYQFYVLDIMATLGKIFELTGGGGVEAYIQANLSVRDIEKNKYGEVFTPYSYICELLDQLPARVWTNPALRWLEPASGIGHFCAVIYMRLMDGLCAVFPDRRTRHEHIIRNMLFMVEINAVNVDRTRDLFGSLVNIRCADFLHPATSAGAGAGAAAAHPIDIIIGNPPFQMPRDDTIRLGSKGGRTLWDKFIVKSLEILHSNLGKEERFLCFITPPAWRKPDSPLSLWTMMTRDSCSLRYLHMTDKKTAIRDLQVQQRMDLYVIAVSYGNTVAVNNSNTAAPAAACCVVIESEADGGSIHLNTIAPRDWPWLPNSEFEFIKSILDPNGPDPSRVIYDRSAYGSDLPHMSPEYRVGEFIYPVVHTMTARGLGIWYSNTATRGTGHFGVSKVILNFNEKLYPYLDWDGEYGMGQFSFGLPVSSVAQGEAIVRALVSPRFRAVIKATKWGAYQTDRRMFEYFREGFYDGIH